MKLFSKGKKEDILIAEDIMTIEEALQQYIKYLERMFIYPNGLYSVRPSTTDPRISEIVGPKGEVAAFVKMPKPNLESKPEPELGSESKLGEE